MINLLLEQCKLLDSNIDALFFTINVYTLSSDFNNVENAYCRLVDQNSKREICRYTLSGSGSHNGMIMCALLKGGADWSLKAIGNHDKILFPYNNVR